MATLKNLQAAVDYHGFEHITVLDLDTVQANVDGEPTVFTRDDAYGGHPMSGLASFGPMSGDHRMIRAIALDIKAVFEFIKTI